MTKTWLIALTLVLTLAAGVALAQEKESGKKGADKATADKPLIDKTKVDAEAETEFKKLDANHDGKLALEEYLADKKGRAVKTAEAEFHKMDANRTGGITVEQFRKFLEDKETKAAAREKRIEDLFRKLDTDKDGKVSEKEFLTGAEAIRAEKAAEGKGGKAAKSTELTAEVFQKVDTDGDHLLTLNEFRKLLIPRGGEKPHKKHKGDQPDGDKKAADK